MDLTTAEPTDTSGTAVNFCNLTRNTTPETASDAIPCKKGSLTAPKTLDETSARHIAILLQRWKENGLTDAQCFKLLQIYLGIFRK